LAKSENLRVSLGEEGAGALLVCNRSLEQATEVAAEVAAGLKELRAAPAADIIPTSTRSLEILLQLDCVAYSPKSALRSRWHFGPSKY
jgi:hypothetical protein